MRLSPTGKESRPYPVKENDHIQFGIDYRGKTEGNTQLVNKFYNVILFEFAFLCFFWGEFVYYVDVFKSVSIKIAFSDQSWIKRQRMKSTPLKYTLQFYSYKFCI